MSVGGAIVSVPAATADGVESPVADVLWLRWLGLRAYEQVLDAMREQTIARSVDTPDEVWLVEHPPVFTLGQAGRREHLLAPGAIPVVQTDRGGQVTYHGPGQIVVYVLLDLRRARLGVRHLVEALEQSVIDVMADAGVGAVRRDAAPGVYVDGRKLASLGLRVKNGCSYHGLALNVDVDLTPFRAIDPCGYRGLEMTRTRDLGLEWTTLDAGRRLVDALARRLGRSVRAETP